MSLCSPRVLRLPRNACVHSMGLATGVDGCRGPWVVVGQLVTRERNPPPPPKMPFAIKANKQRRRRRHRRRRRRRRFLSFISFLLPTFWQLHFLTGVARAPCKWPPVTLRHRSTLHSTLLSLSPSLSLLDAASLTGPTPSHWSHV